MELQLQRFIYSSKFSIENFRKKKDRKMFENYPVTLNVYICEYQNTVGLTGKIKGMKEGVFIRWPTSWLLIKKELFP